jgi:trehalose synthase
LLRQLGVTVEWIVIHSSESRFFALTKRIHNQLHGVSSPRLAASDRELYDEISDQLADTLIRKVAPNDILIVHDPQPLGMGARVKRRLGTPALWRCHIGFDESTAASDDAWQFLMKDVLAYDRIIFTLQDYVPPAVSRNIAIVTPGIDPLSHKNRQLSVHKTAGVLIDAALVASMHPALAPPFQAPAQRLQPDGTFAAATFPEDVGLLFRPIVTQISRWDRLKGFGPLLEAFVLLKQRRCSHSRNDLDQLRLDHMRLVLAGPDPAGVQDDPEANKTLADLCDRWRALPPELQHEVAVLKLPLISVKENALMVNALQQCSTIIAQNSIREGFGLTVAEAMWKARPVLGGAAPGIKAQIVDGVTGRLVDDPESPEVVAEVLDDMLSNSKDRELWGRNGRRRVTHEFLIFNELQRWLELVVEAAETAPAI